MDSELTISIEVFEAVCVTHLVGEDRERGLQRREGLVSIGSFAPGLFSSPVVANGHYRIGKPYLSPFQIKKLLLILLKESQQAE